ncbi:MAG: endonuclease III [Candidatus Omnitrophica bacterium]|nr:endonuclease III [Candidatus Omnitrophota bacterium]
MNTAKKIITISKLLKKAYGNPRPFKALDPVDELIKTVLSQNTNDRNSLGAFAVLKEHFSSWGALMKADTRHVARLIKHAGLANIKAARIKEILAEIKRREGKISLAFLERADLKVGIEYLKSLKGVGPKTAACVLLFSFRRPVMPVDTHIFRVTKRLGLIGSKTGIEEAHDILTGMTPKHLIYELHLGIIEHGRRTCKAQNPRCGFCVLYNLCKFKDKRLYKEGHK